MSRSVGKLRDRGALDPDVARLSVGLGGAIRAERHRRHLALRELEAAAGVSKSRISAVEGGRPASLETYVQLARALRLRPSLELVDPRRREPSGRAEDPVHAALGEIEAARLRELGFAVGLDEPYQHYQFAGLADVVGWDQGRAALLALENRTAFPNLGETAGSYNAKRRYLGPELAAGAGVARWTSETHAIVGLWSADVLHALRLHRASFAALCPDPLEAWAAWWTGDPPGPGRRSVLVVFDPLEGTRRDRRRWAGLAELDGLRPRYRDYAEALAALRAAGRA